jgi:hypothetical protein
MVAAAVPEIPAGREHQELHPAVVAVVQAATTTAATGRAAKCGFGLAKEKGAFAPLP